MSNGTDIHGMARASFNYLTFHEEYENTQCIHLLSYCKRHKRPSDQCKVVQDSIGACQQLDYIASPNPSGYARTEPYNYLARIGRKQPQSYEIVSLRHSENVLPPSEDETFSDSSAFAQKPIVESDVKPNCYSRMITIHDDEHVIVFAKRDMEQWEELTYNYSVTHNLHRRSGNVLPPEDEPFSLSTASAEKPIFESDLQPNCYSRIITVSGDEHVIIFPKRDIEQ